MRVVKTLFMIAMLAAACSVHAQMMNPAQRAQADPYAARIMMGPESYTWQAARGTSMQGRTAQAYYGQQPATVAQFASKAKPFNTVVNEPTISPYMNLYREQTATDVPNYHLFVRPQQQQNEANRRQHAAVSNLQRQVQQTTYNAPVNRNGNGNNYSNAARYGDTRHYYGGFRR